MDDRMMERIHRAAQDAFLDVWDTASIPAGHSGAISAAMDRVDDRAGEAYRAAVQATCAEFGVDERDYYEANQDAAIGFKPEYLLDQQQHESCLDAECDESSEVSDVHWGLGF
jgi:hypothetical protein